MSGGFVCKSIEVSWNKIMQWNATMVTGVQGLQLRRMCSRACTDDIGTAVMSHSNGELHCAVMCGNHVVMCRGSHQLEVTAHDCFLWVGESDQGVLCPLFVGLMPKMRTTVGFVWCQPRSNKEVGTNHSQS